MTLLNPSGLLFGLLAIPLVALYLLKMRRPEMPFSSLYLWERAVRDMQANAPWQKLRRNLLLLLQLLALVSLTLALARPARLTPGLTGQNTVVLLDASASMQADDVQPSRFTAAVEAVHQAIETLPDGARMTIIQAGARPLPLVSSTEREALHAALEDAAPENGPADWQAALALAAGAASESRETVLLIVSDGGLPPSGLPPFPGEVRYLPVGERDDNLAIAAFTAQVSRGEVELFARIHNYSARPAQALLAFYVQDTLLHAETVSLPAGEDRGVTYGGLPDLPAAYRAVLRPSDESQADYLTLDDTAFAVYQPRPERRVLLVTPGNIFLENILAALPSVHAYRADLQAGRPPELSPEDHFDVYVYDGLLPDTLPPEGNFLFINPPDNPYFAVGAPYTPTLPVTLAEHPLTAGLDWDAVHVGRARRIQPPPWSIPLVWTEDGALVFAGEREGRRLGVLAFRLQDSDLPLTVAFPVLFTRLMEYLAPGLPFEAGSSLLPGESLRIRPGVDAQQVVVTDPAGEVHSLFPQNESLLFTDTTRSGVYAVSIYTDPQQRAPARVAYFTVNSFVPQESSIQPADDIAIPALTEERETPRGQRETWPWFAAAAWLLLLVEWVVAHAPRQHKAVSPA